jgi:hypothetical protein
MMPVAPISEGCGEFVLVVGPQAEGIGQRRLAGGYGVAAKDGPIGAVGSAEDRDYEGFSAAS